MTSKEFEIAMKIFVGMVAREDKNWADEKIELVRRFKHMKDASFIAAQIFLYGKRTDQKKGVS